MSEQAIALPRGLSLAECHELQPIADEAALTSTFSRLNKLNKTREGLPSYYEQFLDGGNVICAVGAACALMDSGFFGPQHLDGIYGLCGYLPVRERLLKLLSDRGDLGAIRKVVEILPAVTGRPRADGMKAEYEFDFAGIAKAYVLSFLETADVNDLYKASDALESLGGWKRALPLWVTMILVSPQDPRWPMRLSRQLAYANRFEMIAQARDIFVLSELFPEHCKIMSALILQQEGRPQDAFAALEGVDAENLARPAKRFVASLSASIQEDCGNYRAAYEFHVQQNEFGRTNNFSPMRWAEYSLTLAALPVFSLPKDERENHFLMLGFPRSGTTLLENLFQSHPVIEAFEEIPAFGRVTDIVNRAKTVGMPWNSELALLARCDYYAVIDRHKKKKGAKIFIDKMPMLSARAAFLKWLFPDKKYIFSIRHPYDVVLSCFKQTFGANSAMDSFTTFADCCTVYDFTMNQWFSVFGSADSHVHYIKYDDLVTAPRAQMTRALEFIGAKWDDEILDFVAKAADRRVKTPSYRKVRKGLQIGIQSSWRSYTFLFEKREARCLDKWVERFGYRDGMADVHKV